MKHNLNCTISVRPLFGEKPVESKPDTDSLTSSVLSSNGDVPPQQQTQADGLRHLKRPSLEQQDSNKAWIMKDIQLLSLVSPMLPGFSLKTKEWRKTFLELCKSWLYANECSVFFIVDYISEIPWDDEAFDHLVYSPDHKDLLLTFVKNHKDYGRDMDDVITGKGRYVSMNARSSSANIIQGQGLILLLSGPPGTGKTLTAEAGKFRYSSSQKFPSD